MSSRNREGHCCTPGKDRHSFEPFTLAIAKSEYDFLSCYDIIQRVMNAIMLGLK